VVFRDSLFALNQSANIFKSLFKVSYRYARLLEEHNYVVSSANRIVFLLYIDMGKSFVYIMNSNGPRTDPRGTPQIIPGFGIYNIYIQRIAYDFSNNF